MKKIRDVSESSAYPFPLMYQIVVSVDTEMCKSEIWNGEKKIALKGQFNEGPQRYYDFLDYLKTQSSFDARAIEGYERDTKSFFAKNRDRVNDIFLWEPGEITNMFVDEHFDIEDETHLVHNSIDILSRDLENILKQRPENLFEFCDSDWLKFLKEDVTLIEPYWSEVLYYSFNKT